MQAEATQSATVPSKERPGVKESCVVGAADAGILLVEDARGRQDDAGVASHLRRARRPAATVLHQRQTRALALTSVRAKARTRAQGKKKGSRNADEPVLQPVVLEKDVGVSVSTGTSLTTDLPRCKSARN